MNVPSTERPLAEFWVSGYPIAFDNDLEIIPEAERKPGKNGKRARLTRPKPNHAQKQWQASIGEAAGWAMNFGPPCQGPVRLRLEFRVKARNGEADGEPWITTVKWNEHKQMWAKGDTELPDSDNLAKAAQDAMNGIVWADDVLVFDLAVLKVYGPEPGVMVTAYAR
jgi:Holliday junction resolvase RusA-like endonuclease